MSRPMTFMDQQQEHWVREVKADSHLYPKGVKMASAVVERFVPKRRQKKFRRFLDATRIGDNPTFLRFLHSIAIAIEKEEKAEKRKAAKPPAKKKAKRK